MQHDRGNHRRLRPATRGGAWGLLGGLVLGAPAAWADVTPYVTAKTTRESNLFRLSDRANAASLIGRSERSDSYTRTEAGIRGRAQVSRQIFDVDANAYRADFQRFDFLDHNGGAAGGMWNWVVGNDWEGNLGYRYDRTLSSFEIQNAPQAGRNVRRQKTGVGSARYRITPRWRTHVGVEDARVRHDLESQRYLDYQGKAGEVGLQYVTPAETAIGVRARQLNGDYLRTQTVGGTPVNNDFRETEGGLTLDWRAGGRTRLHGNLGRTRRTHEQLAARDFTGTTARAAVDWTYSEKTRLNAAVWRELTAADDLSAGYVVSNGLSVTPSWAATAKLRLDATASYVERDYRGDPNVALGTTGQRSDTVRGLRVALNYLPWQKVSLGLGVGAEDRTSTQALADYDNRIIDASLRVEF